MKWNKNAALVLGAVCLLTLGGVFVWSWKMDQRNSIDAISLNTKNDRLLGGDFSAEQLGSETKFQLSQVFKTKKIALINFWATWCEACISEMPSLIALQDKMGSRGLEIIAVNQDEPDDLDSKVPTMVKQLGMQFPVIFDRDGEIGNLYEVSALPKTIVMNSKFEVLHQSIGDRDWMSPEALKEVEVWLTDD